MRTVNVAELRDQLSSFLHLVRVGEEILVRDRKIPIARISPVQDQIELDELSLAASGQMTLPKKPLDHDRFWSIGGGLRKKSNLKRAIQWALDAEREETYAGLLGHQRDLSHLRSRPGK